MKISIFTEYLENLVFALGTAPKHMNIQKMSEL